MTLDSSDVTGTPRPERDVLAALAFVEQQIVHEPMAMTRQGVPMLLHFVVIRDALRELLALRARETAARPDSG